MADTNELEPDMATAAIVEATIRKLNEPGGSKAAAILKAIANDVRNYLKSGSGVKNGTLVQTESIVTCKYFKLAVKPTAKQPKKVTSKSPAKNSISPKKAAVKPGGGKKTHPPVAAMVNAAIKKLNEPNGSSLQAIKKTINDDNQVDTDKLANFIRKYLKSAVENGTLVQTKGKGASGSFKLADKPKKKKAAKPKKKKTVLKPKKKKTVLKPKKKKTVLKPEAVKVENPEAQVVVKVEKRKCLKLPSTSTQGQASRPKRSAKK